MPKKLQFILAALMAMLLFSCNFHKEPSVSLKLIPYLSGGKWGYIDNQGKITINPQFNSANVFVDDVALVQFGDNTFGYINEEGKRLFDKTYKNATSFSENLACVVSENGKPQFIDKKGNIIFTATNAEQCGVFSEGLVSVKVGEKWGYLNKKGEMAITPQFDYVSPFNEGLAAVAVHNKEKDEVLIGYIDTDGKVVINYQFKMSYGDISNHLFSNGLALVFNGKSYGYIDKKGNYIINPQFDVATNFREGYAIIRQGDMQGYINKDGKIVINPQFIEAGYFYSGVAPVASSNGKYGYIDENAKYIINPQFDQASPFFGSIAFVLSSDKWGIIDKEGKYISNPQFDHINFNTHSYKYQIIETDYIDIKAITDKFLEGTTFKAFRNLTSKTTFGNLKKMFPSLSLSENQWENKAISEESILLTEFAEINDIEFKFKETVLEKTPVYRTEEKTKYYSGYGYYTKEEEVFDHFDEKYNQNAVIETVTFNVVLSHYRVYDKSEQIFKAIENALKTQASLSYVKDDYSNIFENNDMKIEIQADYSSAKYIITFKKKA